MTPEEDGTSHNISMKMYKRRGEVVLAACDRELLGKKFEEGELHIHVREEFYYESFVSEQTFLNSMKLATIINLVGENVVRIAIREGYIDKDNVLRIAGVPHAQMVLF